MEPNYIQRDQHLSLAFEESFGKDEKDVVSSISNFKILLFGQGMALCLACCSMASAQLQSMSGTQKMPLFQVSFGYFLLSFHIIQMMRSTKNENKMEDGKDEEDALNENTRLIEDSSSVSSISLDPEYRLGCLRLHSSWKYYALIAFLDVQANYFVILSFRYTAVVNSTILTSLSVVSVMLSSRVILKRIFKTRHFIGSVLCILGASWIVSMDIRVSQDEHRSLDKGSLPSRRFIGDSYAVMASILFGLNDSLAEYTIQNSTTDEYLGMMGFFGFLFSFGESLLFEKGEILQFLANLHAFTSSMLETASSSTDVVDTTAMNLPAISTIWVIYMAAFYIFYVSASKFLVIADATLLSLSLQTSNVWTMIFSIFVQHVSFSPVFFVAASIIIFGVWIYEQGIAIIGL